MKKISHKIGCIVTISMALLIEKMKRYAVSWSSNCRPQRQYTTRTYIFRISVHVRAGTRRIFYWNKCNNELRLVIDEIPLQTTSCEDFPFFMFRKNVQLAWRNFMSTQIFCFEQFYMEYGCIQFFFLSHDTII